MSENPSPTGQSRTRGHARGPLGFRVIGALKLTSGLLMFAAWVGLFRLLGGDVAGELEWLARHLRLDPDDRLFHLAIDWISGLDRRHLRAIEAGAFFYALLHAVEGAGLLLGRRWAGYLTIVATASLIPFECYEIIRKFRPLNVLVLLVNVGFVVYLAVKLRQEHRERVALAGEAGRGAA